MESDHIVDRADSYGRALTLFGGLIAVLGVFAGLVSAIASRQAQTGMDSLSPVLAKLGEFGAVSLAVGSLVLGAALVWSGMVLRTLCAIHRRRP